MLLGVHFGVTLEHFGGTLVLLWGDFGHIAGSGLVGLKNENVHGTRATSGFVEPQNLETMVWDGDLPRRWAYQ